MMIGIVNFFRTVCVAVLVLTFEVSAMAQTFSNSDVTQIPDNGVVNIPINVIGLPNIDTTRFGLEYVTVNIQHTANPELKLSLQAPDGTIILLAQNLPGSNYSNTTFNGTAEKYIDFGSSPYSNQYRPIQDLSYVNNSQSPNGTWNLIVKDGAPGNVGSVQSVTINFDDEPAKPLLSSSTLPIVIINTNGQPIPDDPKVLADMTIAYNGPGQINNANQTNYTYQGKIGIELRGQSSQLLAKKQYAFDTRDSGGTDDIDVSLLGLPKQSDWILSANYSDKTMMRNILTYELAREMGNYASRTIYCELIINSEYKGVFVLMEKLKKDKNRINVEKLTSSDIVAPNVTGGYIFSIDKRSGGETTWKSKIPGSSTVFQFVYPKTADLQTEQNLYLANYVDSFEQALNGPNFQDPLTGFRKYADEKSFIDFFLLNEISKNIDGYRISSYFHKSRGGKIIAGPIWDYDIAWGNASYYNATNTAGYEYLNPVSAGDFKVPFWWEKLMSDFIWKQKMICRYSKLRTNVFSSQRLNNIIDSLSNEINIAQARNFTRWNILGKYVTPNPAPYPPTFVDEVNALKSWINGRLQWMDTEIGSSCAVALPVILLKFEGISEKNINKLTWTTASEFNSSYFVVERSGDGISFNAIGRINASGKSSSIHHYSFDDENPVDGKNIYRLRQVDLNGQFAYSKYLQLDVKNVGWRIASTNHGILTILSPYNDSRSLQLNIFNMQGQKVRSSDLKNTHSILQNISSLAKGNYVLEIIDGNGKHATVRFFNE